ncbi:MAG: putative toxin-antitoxin system toxin component, PIN family [Verrucomicrobia bacterium]|nr:putative toxin-antitoxin system toxin component, PIN family [Verrucomicrobiota bacterium]
MRFVLDTNVLVSALRSTQGASFALVSALPIANWQLVLSVPVYLEYQDVLLRPGLLPLSLSRSDIVDSCRFLASIAHAQDIHFHWPAFLADPKDDMLLELAVAANATHIVTHNTRHFTATGSFGVSALAPAAFLRLAGVNS